MCGIVGLAGNLSRERLTQSVDAMMTAVAHRGPDDQGSFTGENFAFGMTRLSIIDLSGGHQPMCDDRTGTRIVYNGEVYNYRAIRSDLEKAGIRFHTNSDTEIVLQSLTLKGKDAIHSWNGMFAVATWNEREKKLLLIRDRVGVKPLYYFWNGELLIFASEIKALLASRLFPRQLNEQAVWDYLTYRYVPGPETIWRNIWKLPPGHLLEWSPAKEPVISRYWKTDVLSTDEPINLVQKSSEFEQLFLDSVEKRLLASDVPVGVMLSGGLDSSCVAAAAVELGHKSFHTFSVGFDEGGEYSELGYARQVARHLGVECHEVVVDRSTFLETLPEAVRAADEPLADLTVVPLLALSRLARQKVKVVLSGEGADEILAGYGFDVSIQRFASIRRIQKVPSPLLQLAARTLKLLSSRHGERLERIANTPLAKWNVLNKVNMTWVWDEGEKVQLWPDLDAQESARILNQMYGHAKSTHPLDQVLAIYQQAWLVEDLLMKADKMTMAASLELRVPFLDYRLVEWANRQPIWTKVGRRDGGGQFVTKHVLRRFAEKRLPKEIIERPKRGFPVPVYGWFGDPEFSKWTMDHLTGSQSRLKHLFGNGSLRQQIAESSKGDLTVAHKIWNLIVLETWLREFNVDLDVDRAPRTTLPSQQLNQIISTPITV